MTDETLNLVVVIVDVSCTETMFTNVEDRDHSVHDVLSEDFLCFLLFFIRDFFKTILKLVEDSLESSLNPVAKMVTRCHREITKC